MSNEPILKSCQDEGQRQMHNVAAALVECGLKTRVSTPACSISCLAQLSKIPDVAAANGRREETNNDVDERL